jgi:hypothetical protein
MKTKLFFNYAIYRQKFSFCRFSTCSYRTIQCCGSGIFIRIPDLYFYLSRITTTAPKEGENCPTIFCSHKYVIVNNYIFQQTKENIFAKTQRIIVLFTQTFVIKLYQTLVWDPRSGYGEHLFRITDPGSKSHRIPNTEIIQGADHYFILTFPNRL